MACVLISNFQFQILPRSQALPGNAFSEAPPRFLSTCSPKGQKKHRAKASATRNPSLVGIILSPSNRTRPASTSVSSTAEELGPWEIAPISTPSFVLSPRARVSNRICSGVRFSDPSTGSSPAPVAVQYFLIDLPFHHLFSS